MQACHIQAVELLRTVTKVCVLCVAVLCDTLAPTVCEKCPSIHKS